MLGPCPTRCVPRQCAPLRCRGFFNYAAGASPRPTRAFDRYTIRFVGHDAHIVPQGNPPFGYAAFRLTGAHPLCRCATSPRTAGSHPLQGGAKILQPFCLPCKGRWVCRRQTRRDWPKALTKGLMHSLRNSPPDCFSQMLTHLEPRVSCTACNSLGRLPPLPRPHGLHIAYGG